MMYHVWLSHLRTTEEKQRFEETIRSAKAVTDRLKNILIEQGEIVERAELSEAEYENPNWANKQAFRNGQRKAIREMIRLVDLDQQKGTTIDPKLTREPAG